MSRHDGGRTGRWLVGRGLFAVLIAALLGAGPAAQAVNLFADPSFEATKQRDGVGSVFREWSTWVNEQPARMEASPVARTGRTSCLLLADARANIRLLGPELKDLAPGRYRLTLHLRGLDVTPGKTGESLQLGMQFDSALHSLRKGGQLLTGAFGWTPVTHVFDVPAGARPPRLILISNGGRLWIDDCTLERVGEDVAVTAAPVVGEEEEPIAPDAPADAIACPSCHFRSAAGAGSCAACGETLPAGAAGRVGPDVVVLADFEQGETVAPFEHGGRYVTENVPQGRGAMLVTGTYAVMNRSMDWSQHDRLRFDVFNPSDAPTPLYIEVYDAQTDDYWTRVNYHTVCPPGRSTVTMSTTLKVGEKSRPSRMLLRDQVTRLAVSVPDSRKAVIFDHFRLERIDTTPARMPGLVALDFGTLDSPQMEGFKTVLMSTRYDRRRGFGWEKQVFWRAFDCLQPDALTQDFVCPITGAVFRIDLPDGAYRVRLNLDSPGGYWGETQTFTHRALAINGRTVLEETQDFDRYLRKYFRNAKREDLPGINTFDEYVEAMFDIKEFDVEVTGAKLELAFTGGVWSHCLSSLVVYPQAKAAEGARFIEWARQVRRDLFNDFFKQVEPRRSPPPSEPYVLFTRHYQYPVEAFDGPRDESEKIGPEGLSLTVAPDQEEPLVLALQPSGDLGPIDLEISPLTGPAGTLDPATFRPGWIDYRITRVQVDGSVYTVAPRYWHPTPAPAAPGVTRRFWIRTRPPADAKPGAYRGTVTIRPQNGPVSTVPLTVRVLPFRLDPIEDVAVGPFGSSIYTRWSPATPESRRWEQMMFERTLDALKEVGCTSFTGRPSIRVTAKDGRITLDTTAADRDMRLIRAKGFHHLLSSYNTYVPGYSNYGTAEGPDVAAAKAAGFPDFDSFITALYTAIDRHAVANDWLPVAYNLCDEPPAALLRGVTANALAHARLAPKLQRTTFMGETSLTRQMIERGKASPAGQDPHVALVQALPIASLTLHDEAAIQVIKDAGRQFSYYNGGTRWTYGRYMKFLVEKHQLVYRATWHYHLGQGDPYYGLDCREDDYGWFNADADGTMVPAPRLLTWIQPGLNDYRYISTLQRLVKEKADHPAAAAGRALLERLMDLEAGRDVDKGTPEMMDQDRAEVTAAIEALLAPLGD